MSFLASFFNSSSTRIESSNEAEFSHDDDPSMNLQTQGGAEVVHSPQFLVTLVEPSNYVHFQDSKSPSMPRGNSEEEAAARSVPMPTRHSFQGSRMRSLSKVFTSLPDKPLPSYAEMVVDQIEFLMHVILLETDPKRASDHQNNLLQAVDLFQNYVPNGKALMQSGRLYSRMMLTSLACDLITLSSRSTEGGDVLQASELPAEGWKTIKERLVTLKNILLKQNANAAVDFHGDAVIPPDAVDEQLACHEMMTVDFDEVTLLLRVHETIAQFKEELESCIAHEEQDEEISLDTSQKSINKAVESCVNSFMKSLSLIFPADEASTEEEVDDGIEIEEELDENAGRTVSNIPKELHALALTELYSPKRQPQDTSLVKRLLADIHSITNETHSSAVSLPGRFSFDTLLSKTRSLLTKWSETILQIPTLVQLGYGGVPSPFVFKDDDDVSSWGSEGENAVNADERIVRSRSFSRILRASIHGRPVSVTAEEKDVIARLASIAESFSHPHANNSSRKDSEDKADAPLPHQNVHQAISTKPSYGVADTNEASLVANALSGENMNKKDNGATKASLPSSSRHSVDHSDDFPVPDLQNAVEVGRTFSSRLGGRRVVKAGRRFLSSLSVMAQRISDDAEEAAVSTGKKRIAESLSSSLSGSAKVGRRNNVWALKQRKKVRLNASDPSCENGRGVNKVLSFNGTENEGAQTPGKSTPKKAVIVEDDEGNIVRTPLRGTPSSSSIKRHPFTKDEVDAILEGVKLHGVGHWTVIQESDERLANRRPGQLKDKYRTMLNRGEL